MTRVSTFIDEFIDRPVAAVATETIEKYADATLANGGTYTPADSGIFFSAGDPGTSQAWVDVQYYSTVAAAWYKSGNTNNPSGANAIGDGSNFRLSNATGGDREYCLMRHFYSLGTYERVDDEQLANGASYTPAVSGFFSSANEATVASIEIQKTTAGWKRAGDSFVTNSALAICIGDGTNLRVRNQWGAPYYFATMRAKLT